MTGRVRVFRSGWCGLAAADWSHARCPGVSPAGTPCVCGCHAAAVEPLVWTGDQA